LQEKHFFKEKYGIGNLTILGLVVGIIIIIVRASLFVLSWPGDIRTEEMFFSDFNSVDVGNAFEVKITQGNQYEVIVKADENIFEDIEITQTGNSLNVGFEPGSFPWTRHREIEITMPELHELSLSGASHGTVEGFSSSNDFSLTLSGASSLDMIDMNIGNSEIEVSGASRLDLSGMANDLEAIVSGASNIDLSDCPVNDANMHVSGASRASINIEGRLDAEVSGASTLEYLGEPTLGNIQTSGASTIKKR